MKVMKEEEDSFLRTLETGIRLLDGVMKETKAAGSTEIAGEKAFTLFDTYGFPLDLTELICRENGLTVDEAGFSTEMEKQKARARHAAAVENGDWVDVSASGENVATEFVGWDYTEYECRILRYRQVVQKKQTYYQLVLDKSPFYAEKGGQVGDKGVLCSEFETVEILDTKNENGLPVHIAKTLPQHPEAPFMACVDTDMRHASEANHSCTHLLDQALREVLGTHVEQRGSLVTPEYLRFDFSHFQKVTDDEIRQVERMVNEKIRQDLPLVEHRNTPIEEARKLGAIALFGEKYGDEVRVVQFGQSIEFCGGVHAASTGRIGMFKILGESSIAAGVRRIEAITGQAVEEMLYGMQDTISNLKTMLPGQSIEGSVRKLIDDNAGLKKQLDGFMKEKTAAMKNELLAGKRDINGIQVISARIEADANVARDLAFMLRSEITSNLIIVIGSISEGKPMLTVSVSDDLTSRFNAGRMVRDAAREIQGGGGGQAHFATAGGRNADGIGKAIESILATL